jgi:hypothetical protein
VSAERHNVPAVVEAAAPVKAARLRSTFAVPAMIDDASDLLAERARLSYETGSAAGLLA